MWCGLWQERPKTLDRIGFHSYPLCGRPKPCRSTTQHLFTLEGERMRRVIGSALVAAGLALAPAVATAQHSMAMPSHEFGADLAFMYQSVSSLVSGGSSFNHFLIGTPVDLRLGFVVSKTLVIEPRLALGFDSKGAAGGTSSSFSLAPLDVNALFNLGGGTYRKGMYLTAGAGLNLPLRRRRQRVAVLLQRRHRHPGALRVRRDPARSVRPGEPQEHQQGHPEFARYRRPDRPFALALRRLSGSRPAVARRELPAGHACIW